MNAAECLGRFGACVHVELRDPVRHIARSGRLLVVEQCQTPERAGVAVVIRPPARGDWVSVADLPLGLRIISGPAIEDAARHLLALEVQLRERFVEHRVVRRETATFLSHGG